MRLSHSDIDTMARCPKKFEYRVKRRLQSTRRDKKLRIGTWAHAMLRDEFLLLGGIPNDDMSAFDRYSEIRCEIRNDPDLFQDEKDELLEGLELAHHMVGSFLEKHEALLANWRILHVEEEFVAQVGEYEITFTPDLIVQEIDTGQIWIIDWKTAASIPSKRQFSYQLLLYTAGVKAVYPDLAGFKFIYLRKKIPTQPKLNKTKTNGVYWVSDVKRVDTTYELLLDFIEREAPYLMDESTHFMRLQDLAENDTFVKIDTMYVSDEAMANALDDALAWADQIAQSTSFPRSYLSTGVQACSSCEFQSLCEAELLGLDTSELLELEYEPREEKNPYEREDDDG